MPSRCVPSLLCTSFCLLVAVGAAEPGGGAVGWRYDGTGHYPDCQPPTAWNIETNDGIRWRVTLPEGGKGSPLVWGDQVIVTVGYDTVFAYDLASGEERWRRNLPVGAARPELAEAYQTAVAKMREHASYPRKKAPKELKKELDALFDKRAPLTQAGVYEPTDFGWSMAGPVTDGQACYVRFGSGSAAALAADGTPRWHVQVPQANGGEPFTLIDAGLVCSLRPDRREERLVALRRSDGGIVWTSEALRNPHDSWFGGGSTVTRLGGRELLIAHGGEILDAATGVILATCAVEGNCRMSTPVAVGDKVFFPVQPDHGHGPSGIQAFRLSWQDETLQAQTYWTSEPSGKETMTSSLWTGEHVVNVYTSEPYLYVYDADTGALLNGEQRLRASLRMSMHQPSPSPALVGGLIYAFDERGHVLIAKPGAQPELQAQGQLPALHGTPFFTGQHMVVLARNELLCVGP